MVPRTLFTPQSAGRWLCVPVSHARRQCTQFSKVTCPVPPATKPGGALSPGVLTVRNQRAQHSHQQSTERDRFATQVSARQPRTSGA